jgi:hypothetical protein
MKPGCGEAAYEHPYRQPVRCSHPCGHALPVSSYTGTKPVPHPWRAEPWGAARRGERQLQERLLDQRSCGGTSMGEGDASSLCQGDRRMSDSVPAPTSPVSKLDACKAAARRLQFLEAPPAERRRKALVGSAEGRAGHDLKRLRERDAQSKGRSGAFAREGKRAHDQATVRVGEPLHELRRGFHVLPAHFSLRSRRFANGHPRPRLPARSAGI